jgi:hypothetical protein
VGRWVSEALTTVSCSGNSSTPPVQLVISSGMVFIITLVWHKDVS